MQMLFQFEHGFFCLLPLLFQDYTAEVLVKLTESLAFLGYLQIKDSNFQVLIFVFMLLAG